MPKRRPSPSTDASTSDRILHAAEELFCQVGYEGVSANDVAKRARVNKALVFYHFKNKDGLFDAVLQRYYEAHRVALADALAGEGTTRDRMHRMIDAYLDFMATHVRYATLVQGQLSNANAHPLIERSFRPLYAFVERTLLDVAPRTGPLAARQFFVTFSGAVMNWCTYAPLLSRVMNGDVLGQHLLAERRAHIHWLVDTVLASLVREREAA